MIVKAKTVYTMDLFKKFARFNSLRNRSQIIIYCITELIVLGFVGFSIFLALTSGNSEDITNAIILAVTFPFIVPVTLLLMQLLTAKMSKGAIGAVTLYEFFADEVVIESSLTNVNGKANANYSYFEKVYETKDTFYLYISKYQAFLLRKSDIIEGNVSDLQNLFRRNLPLNKYIIKKF